jgi:hypothetical protein
MPRRQTDGSLRPNGGGLNPERGSPENHALFEKVEILFLLAALSGCVATLLRAALEVPLPYELEFGEGPLLGAAVRVAQGLGAYPPATQLPYVISPYGPLPYYLAGLCVKLFGVSFTAPRVLVVASGIWCAAMIALLVRHWGGTRLVSLGFGLLYLSRPVVQFWLPLFRVDLIGLALSLTGLCFFAKSRRWYLSVPFFVAALFCKSALVSGPLACFLYAVFRKEIRKAWWFAAGNITLGAFAFLWAQRETRGWFAFHTLWASAGHPFSLSDAATWVQGELEGDYFLAVLALALAYFLRFRPEVSLPLTYLGVSFLTCLATGKMGAYTNYFLEWQAALCLCAGVAYHFLRAQSDSRSLVYALVPATLVAMVVICLSTPNLEPSNDSGCPLAYDYVRNYPGARILSENLGAVVTAGKSSPVFEPFLWTREVVDEGWPDTEIVNLIHSRQIDLIVLALPARRRTLQERWPNSVVEAIEQNYRLVQVFGCQDAHFIYQPKGLPE